MLLYAIYKPNKWHPSIGKYKRIYAFASVERLVNAIREVDDAGTGKFEIITRKEEEELNKNNVTLLYTGLNNIDVQKIDGLLICTFEDGIYYMTEGEDGVGYFNEHPVEIVLSETIAGEQIPGAASGA